MCDTYTWWKAKHIQKWQTYLLIREGVNKDYDHKGSVEKKKSLVVSVKGLDTKTNWLVIKPASRKVTLTLALYIYI
jgi:hypothetical protein